MASIAEIRKKYPQYRDLSDQQLADALHAKHYSDMPKAQFEQKIGLDSRTLRPKWDLPVVGDFARAGGEAIDGIVQNYQRQVAKASRPLPKGPGQAIGQIADDLMDAPRTVGSVLGLLNAPQAALVRPVARAATVIPGTNAAENERIINTALMGARPSAAKLAPHAGVRPEPRAPGLPKAEANAARYVQKLAKSGKVDVAALEAAPTDITAAEALGRSGKVGLGALAKREGATGDLLDAVVAERQLTRPQRVLDRYTDVTGVSPEAAVGNIEEVVKRGRAEARPLYDEAYDAGPVMTPKLGELMSRPSLRDAMKRARSLAAEEGVNPDDLGLVDVEVPGAWDSFAEMVGSTPDMPTPRGPSRAPSQGLSLSEWFRRQGGVLDDTGEAGARGIEGLGAHSMNDAQHLEDLAMRARDAGYWPDHLDPPSGDDLLDAVALDAFGRRKRYARVADAGAQQRFDARQAADEFNARGGVGPDDLGMKPDDVDYGGWNPDGDDYVGASRPGEGYVGRPEPMSEPAWEVQPTARTWDFVKRGLDDVIKSYEDKTTGKLALDGQGRATLDTLNALRDELVTANPAYGRALETSSDYLSARQAFGEGEKFLFNQNITERQFAERLGKLSGKSLDAWRGGIGNKLFNLAQNGKLDPKLFKAPRVQAKLRMALGDEAAGRLLDTIQAEGQKLAFERRYAPGANSITAEMRAAMGEQDGMDAIGLAIGDVMSNIDRGPLAAAGAAAKRAVGRGVAAMRTPGMSIPVRDEAGRLLTGSPQELAAYLKSVPRRPPLLTDRGRKLIARAGAITAGETPPPARSGRPRSLLYAPTPPGKKRRR